MTIIAGQRPHEAALLDQVREVLAATTTSAQLRELADTVDAEAACAGTDPEAWYAADVDTQALAIEVCEDCPVRARCLGLEFASVSAAVNIHGVHGGLTQRQARALYRALRDEDQDQAVAA